VYYSRGADRFGQPLFVCDLSSGRSAERVRKVPLFCRVLATGLLFVTKICHLDDNGAIVLSFVTKICHFDDNGAIIDLRPKSWTQTEGK